MACNCCLAYGVRVLVGGIDITDHIQSVSVDTSTDVVTEPNTNKDCLPDGGWVYMYGPTKTAVQIAAYPFDCVDDYTLGFDCPVNVSASVPWKHIFDCRECHPCYAADGTIAGYKRGVWRPIPMKKKQVTESGARGSTLFRFPDCATSVAKFELKAGPQAILMPQPTNQYSQMAYLGKPYAFDTEQSDTKTKITIDSTGRCGGIRNFVDIDAYLTSFNFTFNPPAAPTVTYGFDLVGAVCPEC